MVGAFEMSLGKHLPESELITQVELEIKTDTFIQDVLYLQFMQPDFFSTSHLILGTPLQYC